MLNVMVCVNDNLIDAICIHNLGETEEKGYYEYEVVSPFGEGRLFEETITHKRSDGYKPLLEIACKLLKKHKIKNFFG